MGLLKKIFKPVAKVLDKVIPNEIKPALPYLAAFAPVFAPAGIQGLLGQTMMRRALTSGGLNILGQLSQEGSEGDINLLSAGLGALSGAMTAPGAQGKFADMKITGRTPDGGLMRVGSLPADLETANALNLSSDIGILGKAQNVGLDTLAKGSELLRPGGEMPALFSKAGAKAATLPAATATGDVMQAQARQLEKQAAIDAALAEAEALADSGLRGDAIRNAMRSYGFFTDEEIEDTVSSAGYKAGGRVGFSFGGIDKAIEMVEEKTVEKGKEGIMTAAGEDPMLVEEYNKYVFDLLEQRPNAKPMSFADFKRMVKAGMKDGGRVGFDNGGFQPFKFTSEIPRVFKEDPFGEDVLGQIMKMSYAIRAPIIDVVRTVAKTATEAAKLTAAIAKLGYDVTEPVRDLAGSGLKMAGEGIIKAFKESEDATRFIQPMYYLERFGPEKNLTDDETRLARAKRSSRADDEDIRKLENRLFAFDDAGINQRPEDIEVSEKIKFKEKYNFADGGLMDLGGKEMDLRGGGFVPIGKKERADDVPARLSKNEFVMTADAVRAAGGGSVNKGAKRMYNLMNTLEARA